jgi:excisionase family DNA binding protein
VTHPGGTMTVPLFMTDDPRKWIIAARKLHEMIQAGELKPGDQLPGRALLAARLGVRPGTLARAIRDLDACGVLCHGRSGRTWVAPEPSPPEPAQPEPEPEPAAAPVVILPGHRPTLTVAECATSAGVCTMTVYRLVHAGDVDAIRIGRQLRVLEDSWDKYLQAVPGRPALTVAECASSARVSRRTVYRLIHAGTVEATQVAGRFRVIEDSWRKYLATPARASLHDPCQRSGADQVPRESCRPDEREKR